MEPNQHARTSPDDPENTGIEARLRKLQFDVALLTSTVATKSELAAASAATKEQLAAANAATKEELAQLRVAVEQCKTQVAESRASIIMWVTSVVVFGQILPPLIRLFEPLR